MNAFGLKYFIENMEDPSVPVYVTFGEFKYRLVNALDEKDRLVLVALAEGENNIHY